IAPMIFALGTEFGYQFYKLLLSVSPLLVVGIMIVERETEEILARTPFFIFLVRTGTVILFVFMCLGTVDMVVRAGIGKTEAQVGRGGAHKLLTPATRKVQNVLSKMRKKDVSIIWMDDFLGGGYINAWLAYFARHNRVWLRNPFLSDI